MENLVESVEFNLKNRHERLSFELFPQGFQLVEMGKAVWMWKTFASGKKTDARCAEGQHLPHAVLSGPQHRNFTGEKSQFYREHRLLMLYFKMSHHRLPRCGMERFAE